MRSPIVLAACAALLAFSTVHAAPAAAIVADPYGDESVLGTGVEPLLGLRACHDAAVDITSVGAVSDEETGMVTLAVDVVDLGAHHVFCRGQAFDVDGQSYDVLARPPCEGLLVCDGTAPALYAFIDLVVPDSNCIAVTLPDGASGCVGEWFTDGNSLVIQVPLHGTFVDQSGDTRAYDLHGDYRVSAQAAAWFGGTDDVAGQANLVDILDSDVQASF